jgi:glycosyltransferase involved in cell wall biosynthesis
LFEENKIEETTTMQTTKKTGRLSVVIPAKNEGNTLAALLTEVRKYVNNAEIVVVDDGSNDDTARVAEINGARVITLPYSLGNGGAVKTGARAATGDVLIFMDGDGQHNPADIPRLLEVLNQGYDMVVGARDKRSQATVGRSYANAFYNILASWMVGQRIEDLTSGFRAVVASKFREFLYLLPNGFSYPTTITMSFFRAGYCVGYVPIRAFARQGKSHIRIFRDGARFLLIIFKVGTLYSPLKLFVPASLGFFGLGLAYYGYTFYTVGRLTNMSGLLFTTAVVVFLIGLVSEQITMLLYRETGGK